MSIDLSWMDRIACAGMDPALFFARAGKPDVAELVCAKCPARASVLRACACGSHRPICPPLRPRPTLCTAPAPPAPRRKPCLNVAVDIVDGPNGIELVPRTTRNKRGAA